MKFLLSHKILPAVTVYDAGQAAPLAEAFIKGSLPVMEITFRTDAAVKAIREVAARFPRFAIGAGTICSVEQLQAAMDAGAKFALAPGFNKKVAEAALKYNFPFLPGVMTPSEVELALDYGFTVVKVFPVNLLGGTAMIKALEGPYNHTGLKFIPMGGINSQNMEEYLRLRSVIAVGGSWLTPKRLVEKSDFKKITSLIATAVKKATT